MRLHLAGMEKKENIIKDLPCKFVLISFLYAQENNLDWLDKYEVICDSGAASIMSAYDAKVAIKGKGSELVKKKVGDLDEFFEKYKSFITRNLHRFTAFVELDLQQIVGVEKVLKWRAELTEIVGNERLIVVYHGAEDEDFEKICKDYRYIGFGGGVADRTEQFGRLFNIAEKYGTKVHGFALTKYELMRRYPFYSVDSTSWMSGSRYGITYYFKGAKLIQTAEKDIRRTMGAVLKKNGIDQAKVIADNPEEVDKMNALAWIQYAEHVDLHSKKYWTDTPTPSVDSDAGAPVSKDETLELENEGYLDTPEETLALEITEAEKKPKKVYGNVTDNLPNPGNIMAWRADPANEAKRVARVREASKMNTNNWRHGKFSKYHATPEYIHRYMDEVDNLDLSEPEQIYEVLYSLLQQNLKRIGLQQFFELADGGVQDKALTSLMKDTVQQLKELYEVKTGLVPGAPVGTITNTQINIGDTSKMSEEDRLNARSVLRAAIEQSRKQNKDQPA